MLDCLAFMLHCVSAGSQGALLWRCIPLHHGYILKPVRKATALIQGTAQAYSPCFKPRMASVKGCCAHTNKIGDTTWRAALIRIPHKKGAKCWKRVLFFFFFWGYNCVLAALWLLMANIASGCAPNTGNESLRHLAQKAAFYFNNGCSISFRPWSLPWLLGHCFQFFKLIKDGAIHQVFMWILLFSASV